MSKQVNESPFQPGAEVLWRRSYSTNYSRRAKVLKRYKNGNVILDDGSKQQFRTWGPSATASATGDNYQRASIAIATPRLIDEMECGLQRRKLQRWKQSADLGDWSAAQLKHVLAAIAQIDAEREVQP